MGQQLTLTGTNPYITIINMDGQWYNTSTAAFEVYESGNWGDYGIAGTEYGSADVWRFVFPSVATGYYDIVQFNNAIPLEGDPIEAIGTFYWDLDNTKLTVVELVDAATAGAEAIRIELDNNSTKLAAISAKTGRIQFTDDDLVKAKRDVIDAIAYVNHDFGGADALRVVDTDGVPQTGVIIRAFMTAHWEANNRTSDYILGEDVATNGYWNEGMYLPTGEITLVFIQPNHYLKTRAITVS